MADRAGQQLGNYRLLRLLGKGGFAEVYLAKHIYLNTNAAIKILRVRLATDDQEGFLNEARIIASLVHPHIVRVLDFGVDDNTPYLVMDYAPNGTLRQHHPRGTILPLLTIISYTKQTADALQYAHSRKLIHRDIKPENLLLGANNEVLLSDFGTALLVQTVQNQSLYEMAGTVTYMAPEQIQGKPRPASDQYGLGVIVYEWLCGECPFRGSFTELFSQHVLAPPPPLREKLPTIPADVEQVVMTALSKDPQRRFGSVKAFANALEQACLTEQPTITSPFHPSYLLPPLAPTPAEEKRTIEFSHPGRPDSQSLTTLEDNAATGLPTVFPERNASAPASTPMPAVPATPDIAAAITPVLSAPPTPAPKKRGISRRSVVFGLAGVAVIGVASGGAIIYLPKLFRKAESVIIKPTATPTIPADQIGKPTLFTYMNHHGPVNGVAWSPDSTNIVSGSGDFTVQVWNATTGVEAFSYTHALQVRSVAWSHDGRYIASGSKDKTVQIWDTSTRKQVYTFRGHKSVVNAVAWSPDGKRVASGSADKSVKVWDALTGDHLIDFRGHLDTVNTVAWSPNGKYIVSGSVEHTARVWDAVTGVLIYTYTGHTDQVKGVAWSPDSTSIISGSADMTAQVWVATTGHLLYAYHNPLGMVHAVAYSPNLGSSLIAIAGGTGLVQVVDATSGTKAFFHHGQNGILNTVAWSPDGTRITSGSNDKTVQVWQAT